MLPLQELPLQDYILCLYPRTNMCPHNTIHVFSYYYICVLIILYSSIFFFCKLFLGFCKLLPLLVPLEPAALPIYVSCSKLGTKLAVNLGLPVLVPLEPAALPLSVSSTGISV